MAASSPSPAARSRGGATSRAESSPRAVIGLHRANAQLQQELDKIDRQAFTAVSNIANHQQAMKMSWRRLEAQRNSPTPSRAAKTEPSSETQANQQRRGLLMTSNATRLYVSATPQIYSGLTPRPQTHHGEEGGRRGSEEYSQTSQDDGGELNAARRLSTTLSGTASSPYLSSPYAIRRGSEGGKSESPLTMSAAASLKLPPIHASSSQPSLVATTNKDTLLKVSHMMGLDSQSQGPKSFRGFYTDRALARFAAPQPTDGEGEERERDGGEDGEEGEGGGGEGKELTLAQKLEKIKTCRYIRHYRPDGTAIDEPYELQHH